MNTKKQRKQIDKFAKSTLYPELVMQTIKWIGADDDMLDDDDIIINGWIELQDNAVWINQYGFGGAEFNLISSQEVLNYHNEHFFLIKQLFIDGELSLYNFDDVVSIVYTIIDLICEWYVDFMENTQ